MFASIKRYAMRDIQFKDMAQQTAVEWLWNESLKKELQASDFEQAKAMEKEQIMNAACYDPFLENLPKSEGEKYYNETYKTK